MLSDNYRNIICASLYLWHANWIVFGTGGDEMDTEFSDFKVTVAEVNRAYELALECARDLLRSIRPAEAT
jgi:hypothetical protein